MEDLIEVDFRSVKKGLENKLSKPVRFLWYLDYYDGPLSGIATYEDDIYYFYLLSMDNGWVYGLYRLTIEQWQEEEMWHHLFRKHVGTHTDYTDPNKVVRPESQWHFFYDDYKNRPKRNYHKTNKLIGIFER